MAHTRKLAAFVIIASLHPALCQALQTSCTAQMRMDHGTFSNPITGRITDCPPPTGADISAKMDSDNAEYRSEHAGEFAEETPFQFDATKKIDFPLYDVDKLCAEFVKHSDPKDQNPQWQGYTTSNCIRSEQLSYEASRALWDEVTEEHKQLAMHEINEFIARRPPPGVVAFRYGLLFEYLEQFHQTDIPPQHFEY